MVKYHRDSQYSFLYGSDGYALRLVMIYVFQLGQKNIFILPEKNILCEENVGA